MNRTACYHKGPLGLTLMWRHGKLKFTTPRALLSPLEQVIPSVLFLSCFTCSSHFSPSSLFGESTALHLEQSCFIHRQVVRGINWINIIPFESMFFSDFLLPSCPCPLYLSLELMLLRNSQKPAEITGWVVNLGIPNVPFEYSAHKPVTGIIFFFLEAHVSPSLQEHPVFSRHKKRIACSVCSHLEALI